MAAKPDIRGHVGCLPFTWVNHSVHGVDKWFAKFRTGKFRAGIAFIICTNQFHLPKKAAKACNWYQRWLWRNGTRISVWNIPSGKARLPFQMFRCSRKFSFGTDPKIRVPFTFHRISRKMFVNGKQPTPLFSRTSRLLAESATFRVP